MSSGAWMMAVAIAIVLGALVFLMFATVRSITTQKYGEPVTVGDFVSDFGTSTLENWQSEFLQLFSFVTLAALFIHKGSAESKDSDEKIEASLRRIEEHLGTLPPTAPNGEGEEWQLPHTPLEIDDKTVDA